MCDLQAIRAHVIRQYVRTLTSPCALARQETSAIWRGPSLAEPHMTTQTHLVSAGVAGAPATTLVGRAAELSRVAELLSRLTSGRGGRVLIRGEAGIGKTALLGEFTRYATMQGVRVAEGTAEELEQRLPFAAITGCLGL